jgi:hypothetical protein
MTQSDRQQKAALFERFKEIMRRVCTTIEDITIENTLYSELITEGRAISPEDLNGQVAKALLDPENRKAARELYSGLWKALDEVGADAYSEALLRDLPSTDKPN